MRNISKKLTIILLLVACYNINAFAQSNFALGNNIEQPSTDVWKSIKYGEITPSLYTGTVNLSVPFYTYKDNDFEIPISFDYASNGCMPNTPEGIMGTDWRLRADGNIAVEIKGDSDFRNSSYMINNGESHVKNFYELHKSGYNKTVNNLLINGRFYYTIYYNLWQFIQSFPSPNIYYCPGKEYNDAESCTTVYNAEPDIFHFNFMGYSGTFHMGYNDTIYVYNTNTNNNDFKVEINSFNHIVITTADGYKYSFIPKEYVHSNSGDPQSIKAYKLTAITAPNGRWVAFSYQNFQTITYTPGYLTGRGRYSNLVPGAGGGRFNNFMFSNYFSHSTATAATISEILTSEGTRINFSYKNFFPAGGMKLSGINVNIAGITKKCVLTYKQNPNGEKSTYLESINISGEGTYLMDYHNWNQEFAGKGTFGTDHWGYCNSTHNISDISLFDVSILDNNHNERIISNGRNPSTGHAMNGMLSKITYPAGGYSTFEYEAHDYSKAVKREHPLFLPKIKNEGNICGGLRIKYIKNYLENNILANSKEFEYKIGTASSGILLNMPRYKIKYSVEYADAPCWIEEQDMEFCSSNLLSYGTTHIEYSKITEKRNDGSKIEYNFTNSAMSKRYADNLGAFGPACEGFCRTYWSFNVNVDGLHNLVNPGRSLQAERGKLYKKDIFNADATPKLLYSEVSSYDTTKILAQDDLPSYLIKAIGLVPVNIQNYNLLSTTKIQYFDNTEVEENTSYIYNLRGQLSSTTSIDSKGDTTIVEFKYITDPVDRGVLITTPPEVCTDMISNNILNYPVSEKVYMIKNGSQVKTLIGVKRYIYGQPNPNKKALVRIYQTEIYSNKSVFVPILIPDMKYKYDMYGNLRESENHNGVKTSYIWGHGGLHLVAICENMPIDVIDAVLGSEPLADGLTDAQYINLKTASTNGSITKFDHKRLVGLVRITDPSGKVTTYDYNATGKLKSVLDDNNNLRSKYYYSTDKN